MFFVKVDLPSLSSEDETRQSYMREAHGILPHVLYFSACVDGTEQFDSTGPLPPTAANAMSAGTSTSTAREGVGGGGASLTTDNSSMHSVTEIPITMQDVTG